MNGIVKLFQDGGSLMYVNLGVFAFALAIVTERLFVLLFRLRINDKSFVAAIEKLVMAGNIDRAIKLCASNEGAAVPRIVRSALVNARLGGAAVTAAVEETVAEVLPTITRRTGLLFGIGNLATLIGLVGTVWGLIESFESIALAQPDKKSEMLTSGIAHAMANTAWGLSIAVSCIFFHMILGALAKGVIESAEFSAIRIENILARRRLEAGGREPAASASAT